MSAGCVMVGLRRAVGEKRLGLSPAVVPRGGRAAARVGRLERRGARRHLARARASARRDRVPARRHRRVHVRRHHHRRGGVVRSCVRARRDERFASDLIAALVDWNFDPAPVDVTHRLRLRLLIV